jgi:glycosyltransferase involved in cell wall biosynthesis
LIAARERYAGNAEPLNAMKKKHTVLIAGPLPPPAGGISVHIQRLAHLLNNQFSVDFIDEASTVKPGYFHVKSLNLVQYIRKIAGSQVFFIHSGSRILKKIHILSGRLLGKKVIITLHGYGKRRGWPMRQIDGWFFNRAHKVILVNEGIFNRVSINRRKAVVQHAFLPPVTELEPALPADIQEMLQAARQRNQPVCIANASRLDRLNGQDLYGVDMCIEACQYLLQQKQPATFIFIVTSMENGQEIFDNYRKRINETSLQDYFHLMHANVSFVKLVQEASVVLRPTNADGDALTIREALYLGKPVLASDVVSRPNGTRLFKTRNQDDFNRQLQKLLLQQDAGSILPKENPASYARFYEQLLEETIAS